MIKKSKLFSFLFLIILAVSVLVTGCKPPAKKPTPSRTVAPRTAPAPTRPSPTRTPVVPRRTTPAPTTMNARANRIAANVSKLPDVNRATVIITGNTAIVGIDMKSKPEGTKVATIKKNVEKTVRATDKSIRNVSVTADPDLYQRISRIAGEVAKGKPVSGFAKQISEILKRITPSR